MFRKLRQHWGISTIRVILVLMTFATAGSLSGFSARKLMALTGIEKGIVYWFLYLIVITVIWPVAVLLISIVFGQFFFFKSYLGRIAVRCGFKKKSEKDSNNGRDNEPLA